jgi:hypothetical protein
MDQQALPDFGIEKIPQNKKATNELGWRVPKLA